MCTKIEKEIIEKLTPEEETIVSSEKEIFYYYGPHTGVLNINGTRHVVNLDETERCDVTMTKCTKPELDEASQCAQRVSHLVQQYLLEHD